MNYQPKPKVLFTRDEIATTVSRLAAEINRDYRDKSPILIAVLKGSFIFLADLVRQLDLPLEVDFVQLSSYENTISSGIIKMTHEPRCQINSRHVLIIEDIVDTGLTVNFLMNRLRQQKPASLKLCALADKPSRREVPVSIDYLGLTAPDKFLVGYGLDCAQKYRNLPDICALENK